MKNQTLNTTAAKTAPFTRSGREGLPSAALASLRLLHEGQSSDAQIQCVRRAWPATNGELVFEGTDTDGLLRAGRILPDGEVHLAPYATDKRLPRLCVPAGATLVVHRLGKRAVTLHEGHVVKHLRAGRAAQLARASQAVDLACHRAGIGTAQVLESGDDYLVFERLRGATLHDLAEAGLPGWQELALRWAQLARPTETEPAGAQATGQDSLPVHGPEQEATVLRTWLGHCSAHSALPHLPELERAVAECSRELLDPQQVTPRSQWVTAHRDLHDKQLMWDGTRVSLLDLDTAAQAEAALDLGNLSAHIDLRLAQGIYPAHLGAPLAAVITSLSEQLGVHPRRLATYKRACALRLSFVYSFRPSAQEWLPRWVEAAIFGSN